MDCGCGAQAALPTMHEVLASWLLECAMGRGWGKKRKFSSLLFCCPMLAGERSRTGFGRVGYYKYKNLVTSNFNIPRETPLTRRR